MSEPLDCATCYGRRFVRSPDGRWSPCGACFWNVISRSYVKPIIRQGELQLDPQWAAEEPWALLDRTETGDYDRFRGMVWRSLLHYYARRITYDYFEAWRLSEIQFERELSEYKSVRELKDPDLLVLVAGIADPHNSYTAPLVKYVSELRHMHGKPTWVYAKTLAALKAPARPAADAPSTALVPKRRPKVW